MFQKIKDMYSLQKQAKQIKKELKNTHIEAEVDGVTAIIDGEQEIVSITFPEGEGLNLKHLGEATVKALNKAIKKSQQIAAEKMKPIMGDLKIPGMGG
jgi:nucleoid-associated protein EbfC